MKIIKKPITVSELNKLAQQKFGNLIKAVVDVKNGDFEDRTPKNTDELANKRKTSQYCFSIKKL